MEKVIYQLQQFLEKAKSLNFNFINLILNDKTITELKKEIGQYQVGLNMSDNKAFKIQIQDKIFTITPLIKDGIVDEQLYYLLNTNKEEFFIISFTKKEYQSIQQDFTSNFLYYNSKEFKQGRAICIGEKEELIIEN